MARIQIDPNLDGDATLPGGRGVVHRLTVVLDATDLAGLGAGASVPVNVKLPDITVKHLFLTVQVEP